MNEIDAVLIQLEALRVALEEARTTGTIPGDAALRAQDIYARVHRLWMETRG